MQLSENIKGNCRYAKYTVPTEVIVTYILRRGKSKVACKKLQSPDLWFSRKILQTVCSIKRTSSRCGESVGIERWPITVSSVVSRREPQCSYGATTAKACGQSHSFTNPPITHNRDICYDRSYFLFCFLVARSQFSL